MEQKAKRPPYIKVGVSLFALLFLLPSCDLFGGLTPTIQETTNKTVAVLDQAINALANQSADWQSILQDAQAKLTDSAQSTVRNEISNTLNRAIQGFGTQIRCIIDMLRVRVWEDLLRIKAKLLGQHVDVPVPALCTPTPAAIDVSLDPTRRNLITIDGYNFDTTPPIKVFLADSKQSTMLDESQFLDTPTPYLITLNLGDNGIHVTSTSQKLILEWKGMEISSIAVIQSTPLCQKLLVHTIPAPVTFIPPKVAGRDTSFDCIGPFGATFPCGPKVEVIVQPVWVSDHIGAFVVMDAQETNGGDTRAKGFNGYTLYTPPPGWKITWISNSEETDFIYTDTNTQEDDFDVGTGVVLQLRIIGNAPGPDDAGINTRVTIIFRELTIQLKQTETCTDVA